MTIQHANDKVAVYETRCAFWELSVLRSASKIIILCSVGLQAHGYLLCDGRKMLEEFCRGGFGCIPLGNRSWQWTLLRGCRHEPYHDDYDYENTSVFVVVDIDLTLVANVPPYILTKLSTVSVVSSNGPPFSSHSPPVRQSSVIQAHMRIKCDQRVETKTPQ